MTLRVAERVRPYTLSKGSELEPEESREVDSSTSDRRPVTYL
jgi:hypothetical protein